MSNFFNLNRFVRYVAKTYGENGRTYLVYIAVAAAAQLSLILFNAISGYPADSNISKMVVFLILTLGVLFVFSEMKPCRSRHTAALAGTFPVSVFERYLLVWLNTTVVYLLVFFILRYLIGLLCANVFHYGTVSGYMFIFRSPQSILSDLNAYMIFNALAMFAGGTRYRSHLAAFLIVMFVGIPLLGSTAYLPWFINSNILHEMEFGRWFNGISATSACGGTSIEYSTVPVWGAFFNASGNLLPDLEFLMWSILLWVTGYFKLKERQLK